MIDDDVTAATLHSDQLLIRVLESNVRTRLSRVNGIITVTDQLIGVRACVC